MAHGSAITVTDVHKTFKLPHERHSGLKQVLVSFYKMKRGYERQHVLSDVSFEIKKGEFFGIIGRNGSGKSTLLKLLAGIYAPDKGAIQVNGSLTPFIELGVGFNFELTGRENVFLNSSLLGFSRKETEEMYDEIVEFAELGRFMDQKLKNYSSGMQVRLAFSIATHANSDILIFDEVLAVGDARFQQKCLDVFRKLKKQGKTIILVSHSTADIEKFCDRVLVLDKGNQLGVMSPGKAIALYEKLNVDVVEKPVEKQQEKRWGTGELKIKNITITGTTPHTPLSIGEPATITLELERSKKLAEKPLTFSLGLGFYDSEGVNVAGPNSMPEPFLLKAGQTQCKVDFKLKKVLFNQGKYTLTVAALDENSEKSFDHIIEAATFNVISEKIYYGKVVLSDTSWNMRRE